MKLFKWAALTISLVASGLLVSFSILAQELLQVQLKNM